MHTPKTEAEDYLSYRLLTSLLLLGLLIEWLLPWTGTGQWAVLHKPGPLIFVVGCILAAGLLRLPLLVSLLANSLLSLFSLMLLFKGEGQGVADWIVHFGSVLLEQLKQAAATGLWVMDGELRTLLLFIGCAMLAPSLQALLWMRQVALGLAGLTIVYLLTLHIWLGMDVMGALLRTTAEGLALGAVVAVPRVQRIMGSAVSREGGRYASWLAGGLFAVMIVIGCSMLLAGGRETSMAPANWSIALTDRLHAAIKAASEGNHSAEAVMLADLTQSRSAVSGYGVDDREMGAPLAKDNTVLFTGVSPVKAYWRGESKSIYDGRGWSNEWSVRTLRPVKGAASGGAKPSSAEGSSSQERVIVQTVEWSKPPVALPLFASGLSAEVTELIAADPRRKLGSYAVNAMSEALYMPSDKAKAAGYTIKSELPLTENELAQALQESGGEGAASLWEERELEAVEAGGAGGSLEGGREESSSASAERETSASEAGAEGGSLSEEELERYLQLPDSLPGRVTALAAEVAGGGVTSRFDQTKAIEDYLRESYAYSLDNSAVPPEGADFVDHFLFEQQSGYCVHFSTAMVIMLRTQGIPARWVKGFASGTEAGEANDALNVKTENVELKRFEVRASDAHAWVEVYFPEAGWVSFDPTPGFAGAADALTAAAMAGGGEEAAAAANPADGSAAGLAAAIDWAAESVARGAAALAQLKSAAAASPAAASAAGAAALAMALAAIAAAQRQRLRLALALRRYGAAYAAVAMPGGAGSAREEDRAPEAAAPFAPRSGRERAQQLAAQSAHLRLRASLAAAAAAISPLLGRRFGERSPKQTAREYAAAIEAALAPEQREALRRLTGWLEEAAFSAPGNWAGAPAPEELKAVMNVLYQGAVFKKGAAWPVKKQRV